MATAPRFPVDFDPSDIETIARWVLQFPFLNWSPTQDLLPELSCRSQLGQKTHYRILGILGRGGFGVVFLGESSDERVAIKVPRVKVDPDEEVTDIAERVASLAVHDSAAARRTFQRRADRELTRIADGLCRPGIAELLTVFRTESSMLLRLKHPGVVELIAVGAVPLKPDDSTRTETLPCIVMKYVKGRMLNGIIREERAFNLEEDLTLIIQTGRDVALALASMHDQKACHRDLSWNNVILRESDNAPIVIDLGNASAPHSPLESLIEQDAKGRMRQLFVPFTPGFVAPEHRDGTTVIEAPADQFSLGVILYLWSAGRRSEQLRWPFDPNPPASNGANESTQPVPLKRLRRSLIRNWDEQRRAVFRELSRVVDRMVSAVPGDRFPSMRDVAAELEMLLGDLGPVKREFPLPKELSLTQGFEELCRQIGMRQQPAAACLFLQVIVRQSRLQVNIFIQHVWASLYDIFHGSDDIREIEKKATVISAQVRQMVSDLTKALNGILRSFSEADLTAAKIPRFGGRLQSIIARVRTDTSDLVELVRQLEGILPRFEDDRAQERNVNDETRTEIQSHIARLWDAVSAAQNNLAEIDLDFAIYSLQLRRMLRQGHKRGGK